MKPVQVSRSVLWCGSRGCLQAFDAITVYRPCSASRCLRTSDSAVLAAGRSDIDRRNEGFQTQFDELDDQYVVTVLQAVLYSRVFTCLLACFAIPKLLVVLVAGKFVRAS